MMRFGAILAFAIACGKSSAAPDELSQPKSIVETAQATPALSSLVGALVQADLVEALSGDGPFTVFAPTNDAFAAISEVVGGLSKDELAQVLEYHVVPGDYRAEGRHPIFHHQNLITLDSRKVTTVQCGGSYYGGCLASGNKHPIQIKGDTNTVTVTTRDVLCSNGVVHIVDAVIIPQLTVSAPEELLHGKSIVETAQATPALSSLVGALVQADLVEALSGDGPFTVFAPTNDAFAAISAVVGGLSKDELAQVLEYHVVPGDYRAEGRHPIFHHQNLITLDSRKVTTVQCGGSYYGGCLANGNRHPIQIKGDTNTVTVTTRDVLCSNGVVHIVDAVIIPKLTEPTPSIVETAQATPALSSLVDALVQADLVDAISGEGPFTVLAPTNDAFAAISDVVATLTKEQLAEVLEYHVITGEANSRSLHQGSRLQPLFGGELTVGCFGSCAHGGLYIRGDTNTVHVTTKDVLCSNGVVHIVDAVLIPNLASNLILA